MAITQDVAVRGRGVVATQTFQSKSSPARYLATLYENGEGVCACPAWRFKREGKPRSCAHLTILRERIGEGDGPVAEVPSASVPASEVVKPDVPTPLNPMLASAMTKGQTLSHYMNDAWVLEPKLDGMRVIIEKRGAAIWSWSRPGAGEKVGLACKLPEGVLAGVRLLPDGVYDGERVAPSGKFFDVGRNDTFDQMLVVLFDVVEMLGHRFPDSPYSERRKALELAVTELQQSPHADRVMIPPSVPVSQEAVDAIWAAGGEGAILKRVTSTYKPGWRSPDWVKVVQIFRATLTVTGYVAGKRGPHSKLKLRDDDGNVTSVGTLNNAHLREMAANPEAFIGRRVVISFKERTPTGSYRQGGFDHWAGDGE